jgi:alpha-glucosidase
MGNHDRHRVASRIGQSQARVATMLLLTLRGTPTTYYGEEIGMENVPIPLELVQDPPAVSQPEIAQVVGRDPVRTPMQWDGSPNAGFAAAGIAPWLPVAGDYAERNVARQEGDPGSTLSLYRALARLRRAEPALHAGEYRSLDVGTEDVFVYLRAAPGADRFLVVLNLGAGSHTLDLGRVARTATVAVATGIQRQGRVELDSLAVGPDEGLVLRLE